jgi:crotonobetainyl-CoA:carnitine CoA-transferase CaiB-like acyl-CoA transferase
MPGEHRYQNEGPLSGIRVIDFTSLLPGPLATLMLADYGADVIKVEGPSRPDGERASAPMTDQGASYRFGMLNRNKRAFAVDLKEHAGRQAMLRVIDTADVLIEGFRPGVAKRLGFDYETVSQRNPGLVYCSLSGYGQDGPYADLPGHDLNYIAAAGILNYVGEETGLADEPFRPPRIPIADIGGGSLMAVFGVLAGLAARSTTGRGDYIDVSMFDGAFFWQSARLHVFLAEGREPSPSESTTGGRPGYTIYAAGDGHLLSLGCLEPVFWNNLRRALDLLDQLPEVQPRGDAADFARHIIAERLRTRDSDVWLSIFRQEDVPSAPVRRITDLPLDPQIQARELIQDTDLGDGVKKHVGFPVKFLHNRPSLRTAAPKIGQHTDEILRQVGYSDDEISLLRSSRTVI